jgi:Rod binding domain-containing protein
MDALPLRPAAAAASAAAAERRELEAAAQEFEAFVLKLLLGEMRKTVGDGGLSSDRALRGYDALVDDALARKMAAAGSFGLAQQLLRHLPEESGA